MDNLALNDLNNFAAANKTINTFNEKYHDVVLRHVNVFYPSVDIVHDIYCIASHDDDGILSMRSSR